MADEDGKKAAKQGSGTNKRHGGKKKIVLIVVIVLVVLIAIAAMSGGSAKPSSEPFDPNNYQEADYSSVAQNPDSYKDKKLYFVGTVIQVIEGDSETDARLATSDDGYQDIIFLRIDPSVLGDDHIVENQAIGVYGTCTGQYTYTSTLGGEISIPGMVVDRIDTDVKSPMQVKNEEIQALFDGVEFEKVDQGYGWYEYTATVENTTGNDYSNVSVVLGMYDENGTRIGESYVSTNAWNSGESVVFDTSSEYDAATVTPEVEYYMIGDVSYSVN